MTTTAPRRTAVDPRDIRRATVTATAVLRAALEYPMSTQIASTFRSVLAGLEAERERIELRIVAVRTAAECFEDGSANGQVKAHKRGFNGKGGPIFAVVVKHFRGREFGATDVARAAKIAPSHAMVWLGQKKRAGVLTRVSRGVYRLGGAK